MRIEKTQLVSDIVDIFAQKTFMYFITYRGLTVADFADFRARLREVSASCQVLKNSAISRAWAESGRAMASDYKLTGNTALVSGMGDPAATAKVIKEFAQDHDVVTFKAGLIDDAFLDASGAEAVANLPSREALLSQVLGLIQAPASGIARTVNAKVAEVVYALGAHEENLKNK